MGEKSNNSNESLNFFIRIAPAFRRNVLHRFYNIERFRQFTLSAIENEKKSIEERFDKDTKGLTEEEIHEYFDWNAEDYSIVEDVFTTISLYSFIVILYSYIEDGLNIICNAEYSDKARLHKKENMPPFLIRYKDMKGKGIKRAKLYLEKVIGLNLHSNKNPWSEIDTLRKIRNTIVHSDGTASEEIEKDGNIEKHIKAGRIEITDHGKLKVNPSYTEYILLKVQQFIKDIGT